MCSGKPAQRGWALFCGMAWLLEGLVSETLAEELKIALSRIYLLCFPFHSWHFSSLPPFTETLQNFCSKFFFPQEHLWEENGPCLNTPRASLQNISKPRLYHSVGARHVLPPPLHPCIPWMTEEDQNYASMPWSWL